MYGRNARKVAPAICRALTFFLLRAADAESCRFVQQFEIPHVLVPKLISHRARPRARAFFLLLLDSFLACDWWKSNGPARSTRSCSPTRRSVFHARGRHAGRRIDHRGGSRLGRVLRRSRRAKLESGPSASDQSVLAAEAAASSQYVELSDVRSQPSSRSAFSIRNVLPNSKIRI